MNQLIKQNWFVGFAVFAQCLASLFLFQIVTPSNLIYAASIGIGTKAIYSLLRKAEVFHIKKIRNQIILKQLPFIAIAGVLFLLSKPFNGLSISLIAVLFLLTALYNQHNFAFRKNAIAKLIVIAIVWVGLTAVYPLREQLLSANSNTKWLFIFTQFLFTAMLTIPFDFIDADQQQQQGYATLPSKYGITATKQISRGLAMLTWIFSGLLSLHIGTPFLLLMSALVVLYLRLLNQNNATNHFIRCSLYFDGMLIAQAIAIISYIHLN